MKAHEQRLGAVRYLSKGEDPDAINDAIAEAAARATLPSGARAWR